MIWRTFIISSTANLFTGKSIQHNNSVKVKDDDKGHVFVIEHENSYKETMTG